MKRKSIIITFAVLLFLLSSTISKANSSLSPQHFSVLFSKHFPLSIIVKNAVAINYSNAVYDVHKNISTTLQLPK